MVIFDENAPIEEVRKKEIQEATFNLADGTDWVEKDANSCLVEIPYTDTETGDGSANFLIYATPGGGSIQADHKKFGKKITAKVKWLEVGFQNNGSYEREDRPSRVHDTPKLFSNVYNYLHYRATKDKPQAFHFFAYKGDKELRMAYFMLSRNIEKNAAFKEPGYMLINPLSAKEINKYYIVRKDVAAYIRRKSFLV